MIETGDPAPGQGAADIQMSSLEPSPDPSKVTDLHRGALVTLGLRLLISINGIEYLYPSLNSESPGVPAGAEDS